MNTNEPKKGRAAIYLLFIIAIAALSFSIYAYATKPKIAYVRTAELIYGYNGTKDAHANFKNQSDTWQSNMDTLRIQYQRCVAEYQAAYNTFSEPQRKEKQELIKKLESNFKNYSDAISQQSQDKEKSMTEAVLNQINSYVEDYAKKKGYDFVIGGANGNLVYGNKAYDITDEVLQALNKEYKIMPAAAPAQSNTATPTR